VEAIVILYNYYFGKEEKLGKKDKFALSKRELDVMNVLWEEGKPMIASKIPEKRPELSINTVQSVLKNLLQREFIEVADIVQSGTVLSRSYAPVITPEEYAMKYVTSEIFPFGRFASKVRYLSALFDSTENNEELIEELEKFIQERKQQ
jgi:Predicted transcriptional regulator